MAEAKTNPRTVVSSAVSRQQSGDWGEVSSLYATFENVIDLDRQHGGLDENRDSSTGEVQGTGYTLAQFFDSYMDYISSVYTVAKGGTEPTNGTYTPLWLANEQGVKYTSMYRKKSDN